eukprot:UN26487
MSRSVKAWTNTYWITEWGNLILFAIEIQSHSIIYLDFFNWKGPDSWAPGAPWALPTWEHILWDLWASRPYPLRNKFLWTFGLLRPQRPFGPLPWVSNYSPPRGLTCPTNIFAKGNFVHWGTCPRNLP